MTALSPLLVASRRVPAVQPKPHRSAPSVTPAEWLLSLDEPRFAHQVSQDVRGVVKPTVAEALRDPRVIGRWAAALRVALERIEWDLVDTDRREVPNYGQWRSKALGFRKHAMARLDEAERLLAGGEQL